jgi:hypothetical protein
VKATQRIAPCVTDRQAEVLRLARDQGHIHEHEVPSASTWRVCINSRWLTYGGEHAARAGTRSGVSCWTLSPTGAAALVYFDTVTRTA